MEVKLEAQPEHNRVRIETCCRLTGKTGVEMEALTAASVAALTIYDMCKAVQKDMIIGPVRLLTRVAGNRVISRWIYDSDSIFAQVRELVGVDKLQLAAEFPTVEALRQSLCQRGERWQLALKRANY